MNAARANPSEISSWVGSKAEAVDSEAASGAQSSTAQSANEHQGSSVGDGENIEQAAFHHKDSDDGHGRSGVEIGEGGLPDEDDEPSSIIPLCMGNAESTLTGWWKTL